MIPEPQRLVVFYIIDSSVSVFLCSRNDPTGDDIPILIPRLTMLSYKLLRVLVTYCIKWTIEPTSAFGIRSELELFRVS
jgi:hypothetical protein